MLKLGFGLAEYFDKLDVSEALQHELAVCMAEPVLMKSPSQLHGRLPSGTPRCLTASRIPLQTMSSLEVTHAVRIATRRARQHL